MPQTAEQKTRERIDADLTVAGWIVQSRAELDLMAGRGIAVRECQMAPGFGFADYLLYVDRKTIGVVEAKPEGTPTGVEPQTAPNACGARPDTGGGRVAGREALWRCPIGLPTTRARCGDQAVSRTCRPAAASRRAQRCPGTGTGIRGRRLGRRLAHSASGPVRS